MTQVVKDYEGLIIQKDGVEVLESPTQLDFSSNGFILSETIGEKKLSIVGKRYGTLSTTLSLTVNAGQERNCNFAIASLSSFLDSGAQLVPALILSDLRFACISGSSGTGTATAEIFISGVRSGFKKAITHTDSWVLGTNDTQSLSVAENSYLSFSIKAETINITTFCVTVRYYYV